MKKNVFFSLLAVLCVAAITSVAYSEWETMNITRNYTTLASVEGVIKEAYIQDSPVYPGGNVKKVSQIMNTGTVPAVVRVNVEKGWDDVSLDTDKVEIQFNDEDWLQKDGYCYYKKIIMPGELSAPLTVGFRLSEKAGNEYAGKQGNITLAMEMMQAEGGGSSVWSEGLFELSSGEKIRISEKQNDATIEFKGGNTGFVFGANSGDLFYSFKNMVPGQILSQQIIVKNSSREETEMFLWAEKDGEKYYDDDNIVKEFLCNHSKISITDQSGEIIYQGSLMAEDMSNALDVSLGQFAPGEERRYVVNLQLSQDMDNSFEKLKTDLDWGVRASGKEAVIPETGESLKEQVILNVALLIIMTIAFAIAFAKLFKKKRKLT